MRFSQFPPVAQRDFSILEGKGVKEQSYGPSDVVSNGEQKPAMGTAKVGAFWGHRDFQIWGRPEPTLLGVLLQDRKKKIEKMEKSLAELFRFSTGKL